MGSATGKARGTAPSVEDLDRLGLLSEIAELFDREEEAYDLLDQIGFPRRRRPHFGAANPLIFWRKVCTHLAAGLMEEGIPALLAAAAERFPHNWLIGPWRQPAAAETEGPAIFARVIVEMPGTARFELSNVAASTPVKKIREAVLSQSEHAPALRALLLRGARAPIPLDLQMTLGEAGVVDGDTLRLSAVDDEEILEPALVGFYRRRSRLLPGDAHRAGLRRMPATSGDGSTAERVIRAAAERRLLVELAILAAARAPDDPDLEPVLDALAWYGAPCELAPTAWSFLRRGQKDSLRAAWQAVSARRDQGPASVRATRKPVSGS